MQHGDGRRETVVAEKLHFPREQGLEESPLPRGHEGQRRPPPEPPGERAHAGGHAQVAGHPPGGPSGDGRRKALRGHLLKVSRGTGDFRPRRDTAAVE